MISSIRQHALPLALVLLCAAAMYIVYRDMRKMEARMTRLDAVVGSLSAGTDADLFTDLDRSCPAADAAPAVPAVADLADLADLAALADPSAAPAPAPAAETPGPVPGATDSQMDSAIAEAVEQALAAPA